MARGQLLCILSSMRTRRLCSRENSRRSRRCDGVHFVDSIAARSSHDSASIRSCSGVVLIPEMRFRMPGSLNAAGRHSFASIRWHLAVPRLKIPFRDRLCVAMTAAWTSRAELCHIAKTMSTGIFPYRENL